VDQFELEDQKGIIEALIFASAKPVSISDLASASKLTRATVEKIIAELNEDYIDTRRSFRIENVSGGYRMFTLPEYHNYINRANIIERSQRLSQAALEALAVIAYKQPITRAEIERIRGVDCGGVLKTLMSRNLIIIDGRSSAPGKPILYSTSEYFLEFFGLPSVDYLPPLSEFEDHSSARSMIKLVKSGDESDDGEEKSQSTDELEKDQDDYRENEADIDELEVEEVAADSSGRSSNDG
jgi:segregation and condensation protein B